MIRRKHILTNNDWKITLLINRNLQNFGKNSQKPTTPIHPIESLLKHSNRSSLKFCKLLHLQFLLTQNGILIIAKCFSICREHFAPIWIQLAKLWPFKSQVWWLTFEQSGSALVAPKMLTYICL